MDKLKKIPEWAWILILMVSITLKELYGILTVDYVEYLAELGEYAEWLVLDGVNVSLIFGISSFVSILIYAAIFEIIARFFYAFLLRRGAMRIPQVEFIGGMRVFYIMYCLISALISLIYLAIPDYVRYVSGPINFAVSSLMLAAFVFVFARKMFTHGRATNAYITMWSIYFGVNLVFELIDMLLTLNSANAVLAAKIAAGVAFGNMIAVALITLIPVYFLRKLDKEPEEPEITVISDDRHDGDGGGETFVGLGF